MALRQLVTNSVRSPVSVYDSSAPVIPPSILKYFDFESIKWPVEQHPDLKTGMETAMVILPYLENHDPGAGDPEAMCLLRLPYARGMDAQRFRPQTITSESQLRASITVINEGKGEEL